MDTNSSKASCLESSRKYVYQSPSPSSQLRKMSRITSREKLTSSAKTTHGKSVINSKRIEAVTKPILRSASKKDTRNYCNELDKPQHGKKRLSESPAKFLKNQESIKSSSLKKLKGSQSVRHMQLIQMTPKEKLTVQTDKLNKEIDHLFSSPTRDASFVGSQEAELITESIDNNTLATKSKVEHFFLELHEALNMYGYVPDNLTIIIPNIQQSLADLKCELKGPCIILDLMGDILLSLNSTQAPSDLQKYVQLTLALIEVHPMDDTTSRFLTIYLEDKLRSIKEHMRITISNIPLKSLAELKKLSYPSADIQSLSYALLTLFTHINYNLDTSVNGFSRVMSCRAWETMSLFLSKPGNVIQTMRKYADCVKDEKISISVIKKAKEIFSKICEHNLMMTDINVVSGIYDFMTDALYFYDIWTQIKHILPRKRRQNSSHNFRVNSNENTLKSPTKRYNKSPSVKLNTSPRKLKSRSRSSCDLMKPLVPKLNLNLAKNLVVTEPHLDSLNSYQVQSSNQQSFPDCVDTLKSTSSPYQHAFEGIPAPIDTKDSEAFDLMFHQPSVIQDSKLGNTQEHLLTSDKKHQYTLSLSEDCNFMFLTSESAKLKEVPTELRDDSLLIPQPLINDRDQELSIGMDLLDQIKYKLGNTPKFSEQSIEDKVESVIRAVNHQEYEDNELAIPIVKEEKSTVSCSNSVLKCMVKPSVEVSQVKQREIKYPDIVKPVRNLNENECKNEAKQMNNTSTHEIQAQFIECDISCIELDESITKLIPIVQSLNEHYKDWPAGRKDCIRKRRVRDILLKRGVSADYPLKPRTTERNQTRSVLPESIQLKTQNNVEIIPPLLDISSNVHEISIDKSTDRSFKSCIRKQLLNLTSRSFLSSGRCRSNSERAFYGNLNTSRDSMKPLVVELESEVEIVKKSLRLLETINKKDDWEEQRLFKKKAQQEEKKKLLQDIKYQKEQILKDKRLREQKKLQERQEEFRKKEEEHQERKRVKQLKEQNQQKLVKEEIERNKAKAELAMRSKSPPKARVRSASIKLLNDKQSYIVLMRKLDLDDNQVRLQEKASELLSTRKTIMNEKKKLQVLLDKYKKK